MDCDGDSFGHPLESSFNSLKVGGSIRALAGAILSNASAGDGVIDLDFLEEHETLHIWQSRAFGPLLEMTYIIWGIGAFIVASIYWLLNHRKN